ncbi:MAG: zinc ABC transporter substrate-binding protein [Synergistaceae bacterium]|nr:zinc ABC transporter substrate-binding protein [Synergistaceae bacterium]
MKFKIFFLTLVFVLVSPILVFAAEKKISITCSLFPVYDFAREIVGNDADVHLLLKPGIEVHDFEPTPIDIKNLNNSDVFIFLGEAWAKKISNSFENLPIINASERIEFLNNDPHIWLDFENAKKIVENIARGLANLQPEKSEIFYRNAENFCAKLEKLDEKFAELNKNKNKTLIFAGEFAFNYFVRRYDFNFVSAYDGENEPSIKKMAEVLKFIEENHAKFILAESFEISAITRSIAEQTGTEILFFDSGEKISQEKFDAGLTFLEIMENNYKSLKKFCDE